jgi:hypothetical protein
MVATQLILARNGFGPDSRSYVEIARAYLRHDWAMAVNAYWSPLYPWLVALTVWLAKPSLRWEFPVLHLLNFFIFIVALVAFEFFWNTLQLSEALNTAASPPGPTPLPDSAQWILGYALFLWLTIGSLIAILGADLGVATIVLFAAGLLIRIKTSVTNGKRLYIWLGIVLGLGYLTKAVMFPMAFVFLGVTLFLQRNRRNVVGTGLALLIFIAIAAPQIIILSRAKGRFTFSDGGKLAFAWGNYHLPICDWHGQPPGSGTPLHAPREVYAHPEMFVFNGPIRASYPLWYDPSYWNDGLSPRFNLEIVLHHFVRNAFNVFLDFTSPKAWLLGITLLFLFCDPKSSIRGICSYWYLIIPSVSVFAAYSLTYAEFRYMPGWLLLVWASVLGGLRLRSAFASPSLANWIAFSVAGIMTASVIYGFYGQTKSVRHDDASSHYAIAEGLTTLGLRGGDKVGAVGFDNDAHWAYLDRLMIVAEISTDGVCTFWNLPPADKSTVLERFAQAGARAIVANRARHFKSTSYADPFDFSACSSADPSWRQIGDTEDYVYFIPAQVQGEE